MTQRNQITTQWEKIDKYSQYLAVIGLNDYKKIDKYIELIAVAS